MQRSSAGVSPEASESGFAVDEKNGLALDVVQWYRRVYALCQSKLISPSDAEDAAQETFTRALARREKLEQIDNIGAWLRSIAHNVCVDTIRRNKVRQPAAENVELLEHSQKPSEEDQGATELVTLIGQLPEPLREVILLHYYEEMTYDQMAKWLDVARSTVNDRLGRARSMLRTQLIACGSL